MLDNLIFQDIIEHSPIGYVCHQIIYDKQGQPEDYLFNHMNAAFEQLTGFRRNHLVGLRLSQFLNNINATNNNPWFNLFNRTVLSQKPQEDIIFIQPLKKWIKTHVFIIQKDYLISLYIDITAHMKAQQELENQNRFLNTLILNLPGIVYRCSTDENLTIQYIRGLCQDITGYKPKELLNNKEISFINMITPDYREKVILKWKTCINNRYVFQGEYPIITKEGTLKWIWEQGIGIYNNEGQATAIEGFITDVTERKLSEFALSREKEQLWITLQSIGDGVITTDKNGKITLMNHMAEQITSWQQEHCINLDFSIVFNIYDEGTHERGENPVTHVLKTKDTIELPNNTYLIAKDGSKRYISYSAAPIKDNKDELHGIIVVFRDITSHRMLESKVRYINYHDQLTKLYNRVYFEQVLSQANSKKLLPISLLMGDVNGLKLCNDVFGHDAGDQLLCKIADVLRKSAAKKDIVARWGGDEFIILMPNTSLVEAERIRQEIYQKCKTAENVPIELSISIGAAAKTRLNDNIFDTLKQAEEIMYANKLVESKKFRDAIIRSLKKTLFNHTNETEEHTERVSKIALAIGNKMRLSERRLDELKLLAVLHDIGKVAIQKTPSADNEQFDLEDCSDMRKHPEIGYRIAQTTPELIQIAEGILSHHEHWDGTGYPQGLKERTIPLIARIIFIADRYDSLTNPKKADMPRMNHEEAIEEIKNDAGKRFDPHIVKLFLEVIKQIN